MKKFFSLVIIAGLILSLVGCSSKQEAAKPEAKAAETKQAATTSAPASTGAIKMGRVTYAAHGTKCFTVAVVAMQGDKIVGASIDDYQFMSTDVAKGVPNSDKLKEGEFATNYKDPKMVLASKRENAEYYSKHMKEEAKATTPLDKSYDAIEAFTVGKTVAELEDILAKNDAKKMVDTVAGATLADTKGYVSAIVAAAKAAK